MADGPGGYSDGSCLISAPTGWEWGACDTGGGSAVWGDITGTLTDQLDLLPRLVPDSSGCSPGQVASICDVTGGWICTDAPDGVTDLGVSYTPAVVTVSSSTGDDAALGAAVPGVSAGVLTAGQASTLTSAVQPADLAGGAITPAAGALDLTLVETALQSESDTAALAAIGALDAADVGADPAGTGATEAGAAVSAHEGAADPHPVYTTEAEAEAAAPVQEAPEDATPYARQDAAWVAVETIVGPQGPAGPAGPPGADGADGADLVVQDLGAVSSATVDLTTATDVYLAQLTGSGILTITLPASGARTVRLDVTSDTGAHSWLLSSAVSPSWAHGVADDLTPPAGSGVVRTYWIQATPSRLDLSAVTYWPES